MIFAVIELNILNIAARITDCKLPLKVVKRNNVLFNGYSFSSTEDTSPVDKVRFCLYHIYIYIYIYIYLCGLVD